jgi:hypothetical protein
MEQQPQNSPPKVDGLPVQEPINPTVNSENGAANPAPTPINTATANPENTAAPKPSNAPTCAPAEPPKKATPCANPMFFYTQNKYWGGATLNFTIYRILVVVGGLFGLDHFYLRSPTTGFAKILLNLVTFGFWFFYDILQAFTERESIEKYGISLPWYGPAGIGGGGFVTAENPKVENSNPFWFMLYTIGLFVLPFGLDYLVAGDVPGAAFKAVSTLMVFGLIYTVVNIFKLLTHPERVMCEGTTRYFPWTLVPGVADYKQDAYFANTNRGACPEFKNTESSLLGLFSGIFRGLGNIPVVGAAFKIAGTVTKAVDTATQLPGELQKGLAAVKPILKDAPQRADAVQTIKEVPQQAQPMQGGGLNAEQASIIPGFTLALLFITAIFFKGREVLTDLIERGQARPPPIGTILWRKENVGDVPPPAP